MKQRQSKNMGITAVKEQGRAESWVASNLATGVLPPFSFTGIPEARNWVVDMVSSMIETVGIDYFRHDCNIDPLAYWQAADAPNRQGMTEIRYIKQLYELWDELLRRHPSLMIEGCASGGRRVIVLFRRSQSAFVTVQVKVNGVKPDTLYQVCFEDRGEKQVVQGRDLIAGLNITLLSAPSSALVTYRAE